MDSVGRPVPRCLTCDMIKTWFATKSFLSLILSWNNDQLRSQMKSEDRQTWINQRLNDYTQMRNLFYNPSFHIVNFWCIYYTGLRPVLTKYQFSPTNVLHDVTALCKMLVGKNWHLARTGRMPRIENIYSRGIARIFLMLKAGP